MKTTRQLILSILFLAITFYSCSSDDDSGQGGGETNFMSAKIDGEDFFTDFPLYFSTTEQIIAVSGQNDENTINIQIAIFNYNGPGTYTIDTNNQNENIISIIENGTVWLTDQDNGSGTATFTEEGNFLKGTFVFTAVNSNQETIIITEGQFNVQFQF
jgi:hypothetical protein